MNNAKRISLESAAVFPLYLMYRAAYGSSNHLVFFLFLEVFRGAWALIISIYTWVNIHLFIGFVATWLFSLTVKYCCLSCKWAVLFLNVWPVYFLSWKLCFRHGVCICHRSCFFSLVRPYPIKLLSGNSSFSNRHCLGNIAPCCAACTFCLQYISRSCCLRR
jgi:hypothetical protein